MKKLQIHRCFDAGLATAKKPFAAPRRCLRRRRKHCKIRRFNGNAKNLGDARRKNASLRGEAGGGFLPPQFSCFPREKFPVARTARRSASRRIRRLRRRQKPFKKSCAQAKKTRSAEGAHAGKMRSPRMTQRKMRIRSRACSSGYRSPPADWPCRRSPSSPVRQTSRAWSVWPAPARPCPDWRR